MYERLTDKNNQPLPQQFFAYCGATEELAKSADALLTGELGAGSLMRFPYGNGYGWGIKYFIKSKHICDLFAENGAFCVMLRLSNAQFDGILPTASPYTKQLIANKYPCGSGGWIHYRVCGSADMPDLIRLLRAKVKG